MSSDEYKGHSEQVTTAQVHGNVSAIRAVFRGLDVQDYLLSPMVIIVMIAGVLVGEYHQNIQHAFETVRFNDVSVPIAVGLLIMMWPILTKVQYERLPQIFSSSRTWTHIAISLGLNWIVAPFIMLALAWATLPDLPTFRTGVILVGLGRCIEMVMMWNQIAKGDDNYCAILVVVNSVLQIILFSPYALFFINVIGHQDKGIHVEYGQIAISVLIYLGIPLAAGVVTRYGVQAATSEKFFKQRFLPVFSSLSLIGLLYTIFVMFAYQGHHITQNLRPVFRVIVPLVLFFTLMWSSAFALMYYLTKKNRGEKDKFGYEMAAVQAFTAASNNFELAIAVAIAVFGVNSDQALAATIGPLVEVPVMLMLTWIALFLKEKLEWTVSSPAALDCLQSVSSTSYQVDPCLAANKMSGNQGTRSYRQELHNHVGRLYLGNLKWEEHDQPTESSRHIWTSIVQLNGTEQGRGQGFTIAEAREEAARHALEALRAL